MTTFFITVLFLLIHLEFDSNNVNIVLDALYNISHGAPRAYVNYQRIYFFPSLFPFLF